MKILFITPHLSTGGAPQYLLKKIQELNAAHEIYCIEYNNITGGVLVVQRSQIEKILGPKLITLGEDKEDLIKWINNINPEVVHFEELPEYFCSDSVARKIYSPTRKYKIIETSHDSSFNPSSKLYFPDGFIFVSEYQKKLMSPLGVPSEVVEYPIVQKAKSDRAQALQSMGLDPNKTHFLNVGLFTSRKNQAEIIEYAKKLENENIQFHFVGNQAENFRWYWEPLMANLPSNCKWWGERKDVDTFYNAMDALLFTSRGTDNDKETSPLVIREAIGWNLPILMYNLPVYCGMYDYYKNAIWLGQKFEDNLDCIKSKMINKNQSSFEDLFDVGFDKETNKITFNYKKQDPLFLKISIKDVDSNAPIYWFENLFSDYVGYWSIPIPINHYNFAKEESFRGFKIELYNADKKLVSTKDLFIKEAPKQRFEYLNIDNPFDCLFVNYNEMFVYNVYDKFLTRPMGVVLDVGANSGLFTKLCLNKGAKRIISVEPNSECISNIRAIVSNSKNVEIVDKALSDKDGFLKFYTSKGNTTIGSVNRDHVAGIESHSVQEFSLPCITLESLLESCGIERVSLLKMDIEGAEYQVFNAIKRETFLKIDSILLEFHDNTDKRVLSLVKILTDNGYEIDDVMQQGTKNTDRAIREHENAINGTIHAVRRDLRKATLNIKAVHLQTNTNDDREKASRLSLAALEKIGVEYVLHVNNRYTSLPPSHNCARPECVSIKKTNPSSLTPAHYGCYEAFKMAIMSEFDSSLDYLMICEGDCLIEVPAEEFSSILHKVSEAMEKEKIDYFSFGDSRALDTGVIQSNVLQTPENQKLCYVTDKIIGLQCVMFSRRARSKILRYLRTEKWDAADMYFNEMFWKLNLKKGILYKRATTQADGFSLIDNESKKFIKE
jgi:FkbM family methyltransferase